MRYRLLAGLLLLCLAAGAQTIDLAKLKNFIETSSLNEASRQRCGQVFENREANAESWTIVRSKTGWRWASVPRTRAALEALRDQSKELAVANCPRLQGRSAAVQRRTGPNPRRSSRYALNYTKNCRTIFARR